MSDPYRHAAFRCLQCDGPLRQIMGTRLVCDCGGLLLEREDLEDAINDLTTDPQQVVDLDEVERGCPRCGQRLVNCLLHVGTYAFEPELQRCRDHGLWFAGWQLTALFEEVGRRNHSGAGTGRSYGGVGDVLIGHRRRERSGPRPPIYATSHAVLPCPVCAGRPLAFGAGRWACDGCRGVFVEDEALVTMITGMLGGPWELPASSATAEGARACPICTAGMITEELERVAVERCPGHGVWFDAEELEAALLRATQPESRGIRRWLRGLL